MESVNVSIVYYSATGTVHALARAAAEGAEKAGANMRLRKVAETAPPEMINALPAWGQHIKDSAKRRGESTGRAEEIAARTVNKERARSGEARSRSRTSTKDMSSSRRGGLRYWLKLPLYRFGLLKHPPV